MAKLLPALRSGRRAAGAGAADGGAALLSAGCAVGAASAFGSRCRVCAIRRFTLSQDQRDLLSDFGDASIGHINLLENAIIKCLHFHRRLVGFDLGEDVPRLYGVTLFLFPARDGSFDHRVAQLGHGDDRHTILRGSDHDQQTSSTFETTRCGVGSWRGSTAGE